MTTVLDGQLDILQLTVGPEVPDPAALIKAVDAYGKAVDKAGDLIGRIETAKESDPDLVPGLEAQLATIRLEVERLEALADVEAHLWKQEAGL